jgi:hypothetical protein
MTRITSELFVSALMRRVLSSGGFAAIVKRGADAAGAVYILVRERNGSLRFYAPAPQAGYLDGAADDRQFHLVERVVDDPSLSEFELAESRFDRDYWIVEIEPGSGLADLFPVMKL